ncbi:putative endonuclease [Nocardioides alpinus]|uniref:GIY-YIG nuclease family protein n=1 Tax=Nocardioides alpinus TaxID=748909 RepID=A0A1I1AS81_9ACTN|nr:GIY-YIG nuclease family protein [Nocardioides alpinus]PKH40351.1 GIY-YIG nuclease family protein [Nocardioides alpinus]SFB40276.1 putative endonuclease [Nocardioides alpinus]
MPFGYILRCADDSFYVGSTWDLERRLGEHNEGLGAAYTKRRRPVSLAWSAEVGRIDEAYAVEKQVQGWSRAKRQALIDGRTELLSGLSSRSWAALRDRRTSDDTGDQVS